MNAITPLTRAVKARGHAGKDRNVIRQLNNPLHTRAPLGARPRVWQWPLSGGPPALSSQRDAGGGGYFFLSAEGNLLER